MLVNIKFQVQQIINAYLDDRDWIRWTYHINTINSKYLKYNSMFLHAYIFYKSMK